MTERVLANFISLKDLVSEINIDEINKHIDNNNLEEWLNSWRDITETTLFRIGREL